jgi:hypothetical protein
VRKEHLKSSKMPPAKKPGKDDEDSMLSMDDLPEAGPEHQTDNEDGKPDAADEAEAGAGEESDAEEAKELAAMPDETLLEELKKRGYEVEHHDGAEGSPDEESAESTDEEAAEQAPPMKKKSAY